MMKKLKQILIWFLSSVFAAIIAYMVWKYIDSWGGLYNLLIYFQALLLSLLTQPTPLWIIIILLIVGLLIYLKIKKLIHHKT